MSTPTDRYGKTPAVAPRMSPELPPLEDDDDAIDSDLAAIVAAPEKFRQEIEAGERAEHLYMTQAQLDAQWARVEQAFGL